MTMEVNGKIYVFGGLATILASDLCEKDNFWTSLGEECKKMLPTNELWQFDPVISSWKKIEVYGDHPEGREQHSASVMSDNRMLIYGGKTTHFGPNKAYDAFLGDLWLLDVGRITSHIIPGSNMQALPLSLPEGETVYHTTIAEIESSDYVGLGEMCIVNVQVEVSLEHSCTKSISLALFGPVTVTHNAHLPRSRGQRVELFPLGTDSACKSHLDDTIFSDRADHSILDQFITNPYRDEYRPSSSLSLAFEGAPVNGEWTLEVYDSEVDGRRGTLKDWKLHVDIQPCKDEFTWTKIHGPDCEKSIVTANPNGRADHKCIIDANGTSAPLSHTEISSPRPRYAHTAINVDDNVFIMGGFAGRNLQDIWRYNYIENTWHLLKESQFPASTVAGKAAMIVPLGMIAFGGLHGTTTGSKIADLAIEKYNFSRAKWESLCTGGDELLDDTKEDCHKIERTSSKYSNFAPRYLASASLAGFSGGKLATKLKPSPVVLDEKRKPTFLLFGGDNGIFEYDALLDDMWASPLSTVVVGYEETLMRPRQDDFCGLLLDPTFTYWNQTCGSSGNQTTQFIGDEHKNSVCEWKNIFEMAWCRQEYQTFISPV
eukprot:CAMPEP_0116008534 /NCGR_PEP_ID=MMETSP0321-20121206/2913_1 /TAXON_ID=163516 /ORGANISM="Leptocylindrus danicus var. danicus, Strain B650" /LENGTH=599 /DNA_ID=CAMNT_0003477361 /DNA_START=490 /DNA_END=2289 /DNA_ORIENTATION=+